MLYFLSFAFLLILLIAYFRVADHFNIIDHPNERSSHSYITIRGGGIIFYAGVLIWFLSCGFSYPYFFAGLTAIAAISFLDDILTLSNKVRIGIHIIAVGLLFYQVGLQLAYPWYWIVAAFVISIGMINAYNFMDGINGITGGYSLVALLTLWCLNEQLYFTDSRLIIFILMADLIFLFFNFRKRAKCFAGDVGSVSIAFILIFLTLLLMKHSANYSFIMLFAVYGVDSVLTIIHRLARKENIFKAHRSHLYQYLANEMGWGHLVVSLCYMLLQALVDVVIILTYHSTWQVQWLIAAFILIVLALLYITVKQSVLRRLSRL